MNFKENSNLDTIFILPQTTNKKEKEMSSFIPHVKVMFHLDTLILT